MPRLFYTCMEAAAASVFLIPIFTLLNRHYFHSFRRAAACFLFSAYLAAVDSVVGLPSILYIRIDHNINLVPFAYMFSDYRSSLLNVLLFVPFGFALPLLWKKCHPFWITTSLGLAFSLTIELLQLLTFRATDINDLMTNTLGAFLGWCGARLILKWIPGIQPGDHRAEFRIVFGITFAVMFFLQPFLAGLIWKLF